jgi:uncharacterized protein (TIGR02594 family)
VNAEQQKVVSKARSYLGQHEVPSGSNTGPFVRLCQACTWVKGTGWPWCAAFVCKVHKDVGLKLPFPSAGAHDLYDHARAAGWAVKTPIPGCVADWNIGSGHTSFVIAVDLKAKTVRTIGGNESDAVRETTRPISLARGFWVHPKLVAKPAPPIKVKKPKTEKATSASGTVAIVYASPMLKLLAKLKTYNSIKVPKKKPPAPPHTPDIPSVTKPVRKLPKG